MTTHTVSPAPGRFENVARIPGSKSHTIRALFLGALARGETTISNGLAADDTRRARECLRGLGVAIDDEGPIWAIAGSAGELRQSDKPLDAGESGLTARLLMAASSLVDGVTTIVGRGRLPARPMGPTLDALEALGNTALRKYPWEIEGHGLVPGGRITVDGSLSSQSISALLLIAPLADGPVSIEATGDIVSRGYIDMTLAMMRAFGASPTTTDEGWEVPATGYRGADIVIPNDASAMVYPAAAAARTGGITKVTGELDNHPDVRFLDALEEMGCRVNRSSHSVEVEGPARPAGIDIDMGQAPDSAVALAVVAAVADSPSRIRGLSSLRHKESDRLDALRTELTKIGARVEIVGDTLSILPVDSVPTATVDSHGDHRLAMSLALLGLVGSGVSVRNSEAVSKTWPDFWEWLATTGALVSVD
jgi:3-phosphoshikimate 1-carboxyvinyltransferase